MNKERMEAFSDGVLAIIITIMVLELHVPHSDNIKDNVPMLPGLACYDEQVANRLACEHIYDVFMKHRWDEAIKMIEREENGS